MRRARPPEFPKSVADVFFVDALDTLVGQRPQEAAAAPDALPSPAEPETAAPSEGKRPWSKLIAAEALEDEIKTTSRGLAASVQNVTAFKSGDYQQARTQLGLLATLFAIDAQHDQRVRWQGEAAGMRDAAARAGFNCKVATDATHREAKRVAEDVEGLVRGASISVAPGAGEVPWPQVSDRSLLMKRLEHAQQQVLQPGTSASATFSSQSDKLAHEAQLIAALAEVIQGEGYEFADDETYLEYARAMQSSALAVRDAALQDNYEQARQAVGSLEKACADCHEGYRN